MHGSIPLYAKAVVYICIYIIRVPYIPVCAYHTPVSYIYIYDIIGYFCIFVYVWYVSFLNNTSLCVPPTPPVGERILREKSYVRNGLDDDNNAHMWHDTTWCVIKTKKRKSYPCMLRSSVVLCCVVLLPPVLFWPTSTDAPTPSTERFRLTDSKHIHTHKHVLVRENTNVVLVEGVFVDDPHTPSVPHTQNK